IFRESRLPTWLSTSDAEVSYAGGRVEGPHDLAGGNVMVVYCTRHSQSVCGGTCKTVYNAGVTSLSACGINCLRATANVRSCDRGRCSGSCNQLGSC
ncbi:hypothetical protein AURDEDRAFT_31903, partial [Auricularia subglabra TFB-10046 SS5]